MKFFTLHLSKLKYSIGLAAIFGLIFFNPCLVIAQDNTMLLFEIDGNNYESRSYSKQENLNSFKKFFVGSIEKKEDFYKLPVDVFSYNSEGLLQDSVRTTYICKPGEQNVFINIFPFSDYEKENEIKVRLLDTNALYPTKPEIGWEVKPIEFGLNIDKGVVGFLGGKSKVRIFDRRIVQNDTLQVDRYEINSTVEFGVYVLGIKVKGLTYKVIEIIDPTKGIIYQKFTSNDGSYLTTQLLKNSER